MHQDRHGDHHSLQLGDRAGDSGGHGGSGLPSERRPPLFSHSGTWTIQTETTWQGIDQTTSGLADSVKTLFLAIGHPVDTAGFRNENWSVQSGLHWETFPEKPSPGPASSSVNAVRTRTISSTSVGPQRRGACVRHAELLQPTVSMEREPCNFVERIWRWWARPQPTLHTLS